MVEASVGFQCPSCVAEGNRGVRSGRTTFGGKVVVKPYVSWTILVMMVVGFVLQLGTSDPIGQATRSPLVSMFSMWAFRVGGSYALAIGLGWGVYGVWIGMYFDWLCRGVFFTQRFWRRKWQTKTLI